jgi:release factor glutamine methyltransferase
MIDPALVDEVFHIAGRCVDGEPLAYALGWCDFDGMRLKVTPDVLIPRPDTEILVRATLEVIGSEPVRVLDVCTGTGAVACSLKTHRPEIAVAASDISPAAIEIARANAERLGLDVTCFVADGFEHAGIYDVICANPPYIALGDNRIDPAVHMYEPTCALFAGSDGLAVIRSLIGCGQTHVIAGGWLLIEHGLDQGEAVVALAQAHGWTQIETIQDLAGRDRVTHMRKAYE